ncbi:MAG: ABC transporter permease, partial [Anaerolineaceae bacterium]
MNILARYALKYLWLNKRRTGVTIFGVILSSALICGVILLGLSFQQMMIQSAIRYTGNFHVMFQNVPVDKAGYIANHQTVKTSMTSAWLTGKAKGIDDPSKPFLFIRAYDPQAMIDLPSNLISGRLPQAENEIAVSEILSLHTGDRFSIGREIDVQLGDRFLDGNAMALTYSVLEEGETFVEDRQITYTVVGILAPSFDERIFDFPGYGAITWMAPGSDPGADVVNIGLRLRNPYTIYQNVKEITTDAGLNMMDLYNPTGNAVIVNYNDGMLQWMGIDNNRQYPLFFISVLAFLIGLVMVGSGMVIYNSFSISISERKKQFGMFASTGATPPQIHQAVMFEALVIGLAGIPLGIAGGIAGVGVTLAYAENIIKQLISSGDGMHLIVSPAVILLTVLFTGATILLSAWIPARRASKVSPIDAIRLSGDLQNKPASRLSGSRALRGLLGFEGALALKSIQRDRKRFRITVGSLMISIILFVTFNAMKDYSATTARLNNQADNYDLHLLLNGDLADNQRFIDEMVKLPQVEAFSHKRCLWGQSDITESQLTDEAAAAFLEIGWQNTTNGNPDFSMVVCSYGQPEFQRYTQSLGLDPRAFMDTENPQVILVNRNQLRKGKLYEFDLIEIKPGDTLQYSSYRMTDEEGNTLEEPRIVPLVIGAVAENVPLGSYNPIQGLIFIVSDPVLAEIAARVGDNLDNIGPGDLYFKTTDIIALTDAVKQSYTAITGEDLYYMSQYEQNQREQMTEMMVNLFFYGFLTLITLVGVTNIINTIDTNLHLRKREFAMLKSVGLTPG